MSIGAIADRAAFLYRRDFLPLFTLTLIPDATIYVVTVLVMLLVTGTAAVDPETGTSLWLIASTILGVAWMGVGTLRLGALTWAVSERYQGRPIDLRTAFGVGLRRWLHVFATSIMGWVAIFLGFAVGAVPGVFAAAGAILLISDPIVAAVVGMMVFIPFLAIGFYFFLRFLLAIFPPVVLIVEGSWAFDGLRRSWRLMGYRSPGWSWFQTNTYRVTALFLLLFAVFMAVVFIGELPYQCVVAYQTVQQIKQGGAMPTDPFGGTPLWLLIPVQALALGAQALGFPYTVAMFVVYYWDLRGRREGFELFQSMLTEEETSS